NRCDRYVQQVERRRLSHRRARPYSGVSRRRTWRAFVKPAAQRTGWTGPGIWSAPATLGFHVRISDVVRDVLLPEGWSPWWRSTERRGGGGEDRRPPRG